MCLSNILQLISTVFYVISTGALIITLCVLIWYAYQTRGLRKETVKQTELNQRPFVTVFEKEDEPGLKYKNSGLGVALNIEIVPFIHNEYTVTCPKESVLGSKDESTLSIYPEFTNNDTGQVVTPPSIPFSVWGLRSTDIVYNLDIRYENIEKKRYQTLVKVSGEGIEYLGTNELQTQASQNVPFWCRSK